MPKETEPKNGLSREAFIKAHQEQKPLADEQDLITRQALRGMQYLNSDTSVNNLFQRLDQQIEEKSKPASRLRQLWQSPQFRIAATVLLLFLPAYYLFQSSLKPPDYISSYYQHLPSAIPGSGNQKGGQQKSTKQEIFKAYNQQNYQEAIPQLEAYLQAHPKDEEVRFYYGMALLGNEETAAARKAFEQVLSNPPTLAYKENAEWNLALALLELKDLVHAKEVLQRIQQEGGDYASEAEELLGKISQ